MLKFEYLAIKTNSSKLAGISVKTLILIFTGRLSERNRITFQSVVTCSKLTIKTLQQGVEYRQVNNKDINQIDVIDVVLVSLLLTLNIFHTLF